MITRRSLIAGLTAFAATATMATTTLAQDVDPFQWAFEQLSEFEKRNLQVELQMAGLYTANVDGAWGPSTRAAIVYAPNYIEEKSNGTITVKLETFGDVTNFIREISEGKWSYVLYNEGNEG